MAYALRLTSLAGSRLCDAKLISFIIVLATVGTASAQLRTGSSSRTLYQRDSKAMRITDSASSMNLETGQADADGQVLPASHRQVEESVGLAIEEQPAKPRRVNSNTSVKLAGCTSCGNNSSGRMVQTIDSGSVIEAPSPMMEHSMGEMQFAGSDCDSCGACVDSCGCDSGCMTPCDIGCVSPLQALLQRLSIRAEVPLFWRRGQSTPALVTTAPVGTDSDLAGELGQGTTQLLRSGVYDNEVQAGVRVNISTWLDSCQQRGVMFRYWNAGTLEENTAFSSDTHPILARPFFNTTVTGSFANDTQLVAFPGDSVGSIAIGTKSEVYGLDLVLRRLAYADRFTRFDWVYGYHHTSIGERLNISSQTTVTNNNQGLQGTSIRIADNFETQNRLHGFTAGFMSTRRIACFQWETMFRLTMGNLQRQLEINGQTTTESGGTTNTTSEGLLARSTNRRSFSDNTFVLSPEFGMNLAYALNSNMDFTIGYNYLMVPKVVQASRQVEPNLRVNLSDPLTGSQDPAFRFQTSRYWVRSLGLGLQIRY